MKIVKFGSVGVLNTAFSYLLFCGLIHLDVFYLFASTLSFLAGTLFSYLINSRFTFSVYTNTRSFLKFFAIMLVSLTGSLLLLYVFRNAVGLHTLVAQLLVVLVRFPIVYLLLKRVVFDRVQSY